MASKRYLEQEFSRNLSSILSSYRNIQNINSFLESTIEEGSLKEDLDEINSSLDMILTSKTVQKYLPLTASLKRAIRLLAQNEDLRALGEKIGINFDEVDFNEFKMGYDVELEHGAKDPETNVTDDDPEMTAKIAWAHLKELPNYYTLLAEMEEKSKKSLSKDSPEVKEEIEELPEY